MKNKLLTTLLFGVCLLGACVAPSSESTSYESEINSETTEQVASCSEEETSETLSESNAGQESEQNPPIEIEDGKVIGGCIQEPNNGCLPSSPAFLCYKIDESIVVSNEDVPVMLGISDANFTLSFVSIIENVQEVKITVENLSNASEAVLLEVISSEDFTSDVYGAKFKKDSAGNKYIAYDRFWEYSIPLSLLTEPSGVLKFCMTEYGVGWSGRADAFLYYEYKDGTIYFSASNE